MKFAQAQSRYTVGDVIVQFSYSSGRSGKLFQGDADTLSTETSFFHRTGNTKTVQLLYLESRIVRVKYLRYLKMAVESCNFKNSSSLYLKSARAKRNMICGEKWRKVLCDCSMKIFTLTSEHLTFLLFPKQVLQI